MSARIKRLKRLNDRKRGRELLRGECAPSAEEMAIMRLACRLQGCSLAETERIMAKAKRDHTEALGKWDRERRKRGFR